MKRHTWLAVVLLGVLRAATCAAADPDTRAGDLIAAARLASGGPAWDQLSLWHEIGTVTAGGLAGDYDAWASLTTLHYVQRFKLGPISGGTGWDGARAWSTDSNGEVRIETSGESLAQAVQDAYRSAYAFFLPGPFAAELTYGGQRMLDGIPYEAVRIRPENAEPFEVWFDPATHLVAREVQLTGGQPHTFIFTDFQRVDGVLIPRETIDRVANDPHYDTISTINLLTLHDADEPERFVPPTPPAKVAQWPAGLNALTVPISLLGNHIYVQASVNGARPRKFLFDTGATDFIESATAKALGVHAEGALAGAGFGDGVAKFGLARLDSIAIGGLVLTNQVVGVDYSPGFSDFEGRTDQFAGLIGYEFARSAVISIDYARRRMSFIRPQAFHPPANAVRLPFTFNAHVPMVAGQLDGLDGEFEIDTGSRSALTIMGPFARANRLAEKYHATHSAIIGYGMGGPSRALLARASELTLGGLTIYRPVTELVTDRGGAAEATRTAGNIGGDLLKRFTLTLDYEHQLLWLEPNALAFEPDTFDRSGLSLLRTPGGRTMIIDVTTGSAASEQGLATDDEILEVDGRSANRMPIEALREKFKGPVGTRITLVTRNRTGRHTPTLTLADQI